MKLIEVNGTVVQHKQCAGLFECVIKNEIKQASASLEWHGPKIQKELWMQVLAFLKKSYDDTRSETQLRLFVNTRRKVWGAWAFPQVCGTGMTTKEIGEPTPDSISQRAMFSDGDGWIPFGTVHHHCSATAFQSGTDEKNEKNQDGLHITVGRMDEKVFDIDCRLYLSGNKFNPDMSMLWDVGDALGQIPPWAVKFMPENLGDMLARSQMCQPPPKDHPFPVEWQDNLVHEKPVIPAGHYEGISDHHLMFGAGATNTRHRQVSFRWDVERAVRNIIEELYQDDSGNTAILDDLLSLLNEIENTDAISVVTACVDNSVTVSDIAEEVERLIEQRDALEDADRESKEKQKQLGEGGMGALD